MDLGWHLDNPAIALEKYSVDSETFGKKKAANEVLESELATKQSELRSKTVELNALKDKLSAMGEYVEGDTEALVQSVIDDAQKKVDKETRKFETQKEDLLGQKDRALKENDEWLRMRLAQLLGENEDANRELTDIEKKALEFEISRRQFILESNEKINECQDAITQEQLDCQNVVGDLKSKQDGIYSKYEPDLVKYKKIIEEIKKKYQPDIRKCQGIVSEKVADRDEEIGQLQNERNREIQLANNEIEGYQRDYKQTDKQFREQIRMAKLQNKPTTRMENSRVSRLNAINDQIQKVNNRANKKISGIDQKIEIAQSKHAKIIEKAENQLNSVIQNRDRELSGPVKTYEGILQDRDSQIAELQSKLEQRENAKNSKVNKLNSDISSQRQAQEKNNNDIDQKIIEFVMSGDTCFSDVLDETNAPFIALQGRVNTWMEMLSIIKKGKMSDAYQKEHENQRAGLASKSFDELQKELAEATQFSDQLTLFAKNNGLLTIVGGTVAAFGLLFIIIFDVILKKSFGLAGITILALGVVLAILTIVKTKKEFGLICKYVSLASDYQSFPSISSHSTEVTQARELAKMKSMGEKIYDVHYGRTEAQSIHDAKNADIKSDYERNLKLISREFENKRAQIEREKEGAINKIRTDAADGESTFVSEKEEIQDEIKSLTVRVEGMDARIRELKVEIDNNNLFLEAFESEYSVFEKHLQNDKWIPPMQYTQGKLSDVLYIIPENGECDEFGHKKIYRINHNKKALVVNYDISEVEDGKVDQINMIIHDIMFDLMYSVYRMNSKETYAQFVVDEMACTNDLKSTNVKNAFNIIDVAGKLDELKGRIKSFATQRERLAERGTTMDALNESKFASQERPETYNILYIIYKPNERKSKLDDDIRMLIPECDKYGFLPVFICEKDTWEGGIQEKESIYKEIKSLANDSIVIYNGNTYSIAI